MSEDARTRPRELATLAARVKAATWDLVVVAIWAGIAALAGVAYRLTGTELATPLASDIFAFSTLVAPVVLTFAYQEASPRRATFGKQRVGLVVVDSGKGRLGFGRSLARSLVKFTPWQLGHTAVFGLMADPTRPGLIALAMGSQSLVLVSVLLVWLSPESRALHDLVAGTRVLRGDERSQLEPLRWKSIMKRR